MEEARSLRSFGSGQLEDFDCFWSAAGAYTRPSDGNSGYQLLYSLHLTKKYTDEDLKTVRKNIPNISEEELHRNYEYYDWSAGLDFKFEESKLTFLAVSWAETN